MSAVPVSSSDKFYDKFNEIVKVEYHRFTQTLSHTDTVVAAMNSRSPFHKLVLNLMVDFAYSELQK